jgi:hypothetical protein
VRIFASTRWGWLDALAVSSGVMVNPEASRDDLVGRDACVRPASDREPQAVIAVRRATEAAMSYWLTEVKEPISDVRVRFACVAIEEPSHQRPAQTDDNS